MTHLTLRTLFLGAATRYADRLAVSFGDDTLTYDELHRAANRAAHALHAHGVGPGTPVALMTSNCLEYVVADQALIRLGATKVPLNDLLSDDERRFILTDSGAEVAIATASQIGSALAVRDQGGALRLVIGASLDGERLPGCDADWAEWIAPHPDTVPDVFVEPTGIARLGYTGGTTGRPKGVVHTQTTASLNMLAHLIEMELVHEDRLLLTSPLPHAAGALLQAALLAGVSTHIEPNFDLDVVLDQIEHHGATYLFMVPTMIYRLLDRLVSDPRPLPGLRTILYGAAPITPDRVAQGLELLGPVFVQLYGQSEVPNWITRLRRDDHRVDADRVHLLASCGQAVMMCEVTVRNEHGDLCTPGEVGEVVVRSPYAMVRYHQRPEATESTLRDGWVHTGDMAWMDEAGYVYLVDRKHDMIISGGMNVYSAEVEHCIGAVAGVGSVAVVGVPHPDWGEAVVAYVVSSHDGAVDEDAIRSACRAQLAKYKQPKSVRFVSELPLTSVGKIDKRSLRSAWGDW